LAGLEQAHRQAARVGELLRSHTADRPRANQAYQAASLALERVAHESRSPRNDWKALARRLDEANSDLAGAERFAQEDIRLAQQATAAVQAAERQIEQTRSYYSLGISADASQAERQLALVQQQWSAQAYEQVIQLAAAAERAARQAYNDAVQAVERKQRQIDEERRRREAAERAAAQALVIATLNRASRGSSFGSSGGFGSTGSGGFGSSRSSSGSRSGGSSSSSSSWKSSSSHSSW
jgi:colicin import membrane protein